MNDLVVRTRPSVDVPLAIVAIGLALLLAFSARGSLAAHPAPATASPIATPVPTQAAPAAPVAPKERGKGRG